MSRCLGLIAMVAVAASSGVAFGDDEVLQAKLRTAKESYQKESETLRDGVLKSLKKAEDTARKAGNKSLLDKIKDETTAFESKGTLTTVVSVREYHRSIRKARKNLEDVYLQSIKALTKASMIDEANTLERELGEFQIAAGIFLGKHYAVIKQRLSWHEAKAASEKMGGHLAIIRNEAEARYLTSLVKVGTVNNPFIGATDEKREGQWLWIDGTVVSYNNWDRERGQPNDDAGDGRPENYAIIMRDRNGKWNDVPDTYSAVDGFICEWE